MFAQAREIHHEGVFKLAVHLLLHPVEVTVPGALFKLAAEQLFPVWPPCDLVHALAVNQRARAGGRQVVTLRGAVQILVVEGEGFVIVVNLRHLRVGEDFRQHPQLAAETRGQLAGNTADPAALPGFLILPVFRIADAGLGFDVVKPGVLHAFAPGPDVFAGHRAGVTADAFIKIEDHANL